MLTDVKVRNEKVKFVVTDGHRRAVAHKVQDREGLYLYVTAAGAKSWRYDYRFAQKRYTLTLGKYPAMSLGKARAALTEARDSLHTGKNPAVIKKRKKQADILLAGDTFKALAESWYVSKASKRGTSWAKNIRRWLDKDIYPEIGSRPIREISPADVLSVLKKMESRGAAHSANYIRTVIGQVFDFAIANLRAEFNPTHSLRNAIEVPAQVHRVPLKPADIPKFIRAIDEYSGRITTKIAMKLLLYTFVRRGELTNAMWPEFDLDKAEWQIPAERMKGGIPHKVPLATQVVDLLRYLKPLSGGEGYLFPHHGSMRKPMSGDSFHYAFKEMGFAGKFTPHGTRATASTILNEHGYRSDLIERQLAHVEHNKVRAAYNRAEYLPERKEMMQQWADYIDALCSGTNVTPIGRAA